MQIGKPLMTLGIMASMMPMMTSCENKESQIENPLEWMPLNRKYILSEDKAKNDAISLQIGKNIDIFQKFAKGVEEKGFTDEVWKQFVDEYEKRNIGSKAYLEQSRAYFEKAMNDSASVDAIKEGKVYNWADRYVELLIAAAFFLGVSVYVLAPDYKVGGKALSLDYRAVKIFQKFLYQVNAHGLTKDKWNKFSSKIREIADKDFKFAPKTEEFVKALSKVFFKSQTIQGAIDKRYYTRAALFELLSFNEKVLKHQCELSSETIAIATQNVVRYFAQVRSKEGEALNTLFMTQNAERLTMYKIPREILCDELGMKSNKVKRYAMITLAGILGVMAVNSSLTRSEKAESQIVNAQVAEYQKFQRTGEDNHIKQQTSINMPKPQKVETQAVLPTAKMIRQETQNQRN